MFCGLQWETGSVVTQLTQQPPVELLAATQAEGEDGTQAEIWEVGRAFPRRFLSS